MAQHWLQRHASSSVVDRRRLFKDLTDISRVEAALTVLENRPLLAPPHLRDATLPAPDWHAIGDVLRRRLQS